LAAVAGAMVAAIPALTAREDWRNFLRFIFI
jgi:hypothetical protein